MRRSSMGSSGMATATTLDTVPEVKQKKSGFFKALASLFSGSKSPGGCWPEGAEGGGESFVCVCEYQCPCLRLVFCVATDTSTWHPSPPSSLFPTAHVSDHTAWLVLCFR